jgi:hypothetical protein
LVYPVPRLIIVGRPKTDYAEVHSTRGYYG